MSSPVLARNFAISKLSISPLKILDNGGKQAYANYDGGKFLLQTPALSLPYNMNDKAFDPSKPIKYTVEMSLRGYEEAGNKAKELYDVLQSIDEFMIEQGVKNSRSWFKSDMKQDVVRALYTPIVKWSKDKNGDVKPYPPGVKVTLRKTGENFEVKMFDANKEEYQGVPVEDLLVKGAVVRCVMQCTGVWFAGGKYGLSWKANQMVMDKVPESIRGYAFVDDEEGDIVDDSAFTAPAPTPAAAAPTLAAAPTSVTAAVMPQEEDIDLDDAPEDADPIPLPKKVQAPLVKAGITKKVIAKK
jgi:hypothetical protein